MGFSSRQTAENNKAVAEKKQVTFQNTANSNTIHARKEKMQHYLKISDNKRQKLDQEVTVTENLQRDRRRYNPNNFENAVFPYNN